MPRSTRATDRNYESHAPVPHPDAMRNTPRPPPPSAPPAQNADIGLASEFIVSRRVPVPCSNIVWVRHVHSVVRNASNIRTFLGRYVHEDDGMLTAHPGGIYLVCRQDRNHDQWVYAYLLLPDDIWIEIADPPVQRVSGWHQLLRETIATWTTIPKVQRIAQACMHAELTLQQIIQDEVRSASPTAVTANTRAVREAQQAIAHFRDIAERARNSAVTQETVTERFNNFIDGLAIALQVDAADVRTHIREILGTQVIQLGARIPPRQAIINASTAKLDEVAGLAETALANVQDARQERDYTLNVLQQIGAPFDNVDDVARDKCLLKLFRDDAFKAIAKHLRDEYSFRTSAQAIRDAINILANTHLADERQDLPTSQTRRTRRIRIGRKDA